MELTQLVDNNDSKIEQEIVNKLQFYQTQFESLEFNVLFSGKFDKNNAILSIHAGTGGVDAQDWAQMLRRMYLRFCEKHGFSAIIVDETVGNEAGIKSCTLEINGLYAYGWFKSENGVHRLVRISPFDAEKMRHTSFALVEVIPEIEETETIEIKDSDLKIEVMRAGGHGGQSVNTTDSAVRISHLPTGITVKCQNERSQAQNKAMALKIIKSKLLLIQEQQLQEKRQQLKGEYRQVQWGNQIRSYVLQPYHLVKDHRSNLEITDTEAVLNGEIEPLIESYLRHIAKHH